MYIGPPAFMESITLGSCTACPCIAIDRSSGAIVVGCLTSSGLGASAVILSLWSIVSFTLQVLPFILSGPFIDPEASGTEREETTEDCRKNHVKYGGLLGSTRSLVLPNQKWTPSSTSLLGIFIAGIQDEKTASVRNAQCLLLATGEASIVR